ncbi:GNAT family N-acetyltransferase [Halobacillus salinarum]|uniref:GNAT family N-acetyltransferase n=1 Tax=Halobacillus salinarum TaxID=2932257 RepID=A0ABY4EP21_9BACI|nr:GNAT family N-acetyltransferase [Halobacillus salinarum]UOQ43826.1 GNAT family N-acetyltransferase [Halobacillus salinarum]
MIRQAVAADSQKLQPLLNTLGYPASLVSIKERMERIVQHSDYMTFVFEEREELLGMVGMSFSLAYHKDEPHVRIIAFVVLENAQGKGIGRKLMKQAEAWARQKGAGTLMLNSGNRKEREETHNIYRHMGFAGTATGFYKNISL